MNYDLILRLNRLGVRAHVSGKPSDGGMMVTFFLSSTISPFNSPSSSVAEIKTLIDTCDQAVMIEVGVIRKTVHVSSMGLVSFRIHTSDGSAAWLPDREQWIS